jgi:hypothetical protein
MKIIGPSSESKRSCRRRLEDWSEEIKAAPKAGGRPTPAGRS